MVVLLYNFCNFVYGYSIYVKLNNVIKMKNYLLTISFLIIYFESMGQGTVSYSYDDSGNRISRTIVLNSLKQESLPSTADSIDFKGNNADQPDGLAELQEPMVYPNPVHTILNFVPPQNAGTEKYNVVIFDMSGRPLYNAISNGSKLEIDVSGLARGIYILKVISSGKKRYDWKIIKE